MSGTSGHTIDEEHQEIPKQKRIQVFGIVRIKFSVKECFQH